MRTLAIHETYNDHLTESDERQLEEGLRILARIIAKAILRKRSLQDRPSSKECSDSTADAYQVASTGKPDESLVLSVKAVAKILGLSRNSAYEAVRTGQIPSLRFGKRILVPRVALNKMLSQTDTCGSGHG
jgi:excisionase family DNA binding protein